MSTLSEFAVGPWELFPAAPESIRAWISDRYREFELAEYLELLAQSDGLGQVFDEDGQRFVHNMLLLSAAEALEWSENEFAGRALVIGSPGIDGILFVLQPSRREVFAYYPIDQEFTLLASSLWDFVGRCVRNEVRL